MAAPRPPDPVTLAAARDTGTPGYRIVSTAPPESALPPLPPDELARRESQERLWVRVLRFVLLVVVMTTITMWFERLNPILRESDVPLGEYLIWWSATFGLSLVIVAVIERAAAMTVRVVRSRRSAPRA